MVLNQTRRTFLRTAPLAAAAVSLPLSEKFAVAATAPEPIQVLKADKLAAAMAKLHSAPGNENLYDSKTLPMTVVMTTEEKKAGKEFEWHEGRDHIFQILEGTTTYELGGTPTNGRNTKPGEWLAPASAGATSVTVSKGDMLVIPRGTPHKRITESSVTFILISSTGSVQS
jgi:quercetin dioxygenase-like cupin family protein